MKRFLSIATVTLVASLHPSLSDADDLNVVSSFSSDQPIRGVVRSPKRIPITTDITVPILEVPFSEGETFAEGEMLLDLDCTRLQAQRNAARAAHRAAAVELRQKRHLLKYGAAGRGEVDLASAEASRSFSEIEAIEAGMRDCTINAPFAGRVVELFVRPTQRTPSGEVMLTIIDNSELEIELVVPSNWLRWVEKGQLFTFEVDETGQALEAVVARTGAEVDPVSQTVKLYGRFNSDADRVLAGMSGNARFPTITGEPLTGAVQ
ncbi:MAG: HlyD family efflux transporter periplasmic adaptor subunit [Pseudomonadota bacterium]